MGWSRERHVRRKALGPVVCSPTPADLGVVGLAERDRSCDVIRPFLCAASGRFVRLTAVRLASSPDFTTLSRRPRSSLRLVGGGASRAGRCLDGAVAGILRRPPPKRVRRSQGPY